MQTFAERKKKKESLHSVELRPRLDEQSLAKPEEDEAEQEIARAEDVAHICSSDEQQHHCEPERVAEYQHLRIVQVRSEKHSPEPLCSVDRM